MTSRIEYLREEIRVANIEYYGDSRPSLTDAEYDAKMRELNQLEEENGPAPADSPTMTVGAPVADDYGKVAHNPPMLSLKKADTAAELSNWIAGLPAYCRAFDVSVKYDGLGVALHYRDGELVRAATRGDGQTGEDITHAALHIPDIPRIIAFGGNVEVRGEVVAINALFHEYNALVSEMGGEPYSSPRNFASGTLRSLEADRGRLATLSFIPYWQNGIGGMSRHSEIHEALGLAGFSSGYAYATPSSLEDIIEVFTRMEAARDQTMPYDTDGIVVKVDDIDDFDSLGNASNAPNGAIAYKFASSSAQTTFKAIEWQVGRTGVITPRAVLERVQVGDVEVESATLHNLDYIAKLDLRYGDTVVVERAGEVIPAVRSVMVEMRDGSERLVETPSVCPACATDLVVDGPVRLYCLNPHCKAQAERKIQHFCSRDYMDIDHIGPGVIELLHTHGYIEDVADIYSLYERREEMIALPGMGEASVGQLLAAIESSKSQPLHRVLAALGIREVGRSASRAIAEFAGDMERARSLSRDELESLPDMGPIMTSYYLAYMTNVESASLIDRLAEASVNMAEPKAKTAEAATIFEGKKVVVTGKLISYKRNEIHERIKELGGTTSGSVSKRTDYLIVGENAGSKLAKATSLGVSVLTEDEFHQLVG